MKYYLKIYKESLKNQLKKNLLLKNKIMKLDGKSIQAAIAQLVEDYKFDPYKILEIVKL